MLQYICSRRVLLLRLVLVASRVVARCDDETAALRCPSVDSLDDVDELLLVRDCPVAEASAYFSLPSSHLVIVTRPQVDHDMLVTVVSPAQTERALGK